VIQINRRNRMLARGQTSKEGIQLLSFNRNEVIVKIDGTRYRYKKKVERV